MIRPRTLPLRLILAGLLGTIAGIHLDLYGSDGYRHIPTIGVLFVLNGAAGIALALAVVLASRALVALAAIGAVVFAAATLVALVVSVNGRLFGFTESSHAPLFGPAIGVEGAAVIVGILLAITSRGRWARDALGRHPTPTSAPEIKHGV